MDGPWTDRTDSFLQDAPFLFCVPFPFPSSSLIPVSTFPWPRLNKPHFKAQEQRSPLQNRSRTRPNLIPHVAMCHAYRPYTPFSSASLSCIALALALALSAAKNVATAFRSHWIGVEWSELLLPEPDVGCLHKTRVCSKAGRGESAELH
jgi:hypothetical protein